MFSADDASLLRAHVRERHQDNGRQTTGMTRTDTEADSKATVEGQLLQASGL